MVLVLKGIFPETTYACVPLYHFLSSQHTANKFQTGSNLPRPLPPSLTAKEIPKDSTLVRVNDGSNNVTSFGGEMRIVILDLDKINLDYVNFDENDQKLLFMSDLWLGIMNLNNLKHSMKI